MRTLPPEWVALETANNPQPALLIHIYARRDGSIVLPDGWGSWTYSSGFQGNVDFTDKDNYASDWVDPNTPTTRTYAPAAIEFDPGQVFRKEGTALDPQGITLTVDPQIDPFLNYVNNKWQLTFGIVIYKVFRNGNAVKTVDDGHGNQIPAVTVAFVGWLDSDDALDLNSVGLETIIDDGKLKLSTKWDRYTKRLVRQVPRPEYAINCPKILFSTGNASVACNADPQYVRIDGFVAQTNGVIISSPDWAIQPSGWFAEGYIEATCTDPISGLDFTFRLQVGASEIRTSLGVTYHDLTLRSFPPLPLAGMIVSAFGGCIRDRPTCIGKHIPVGTIPPAPGTPSPGHIDVALQLFDSVSSHAKTARVIITPTQLSIFYTGTDPTQIGNFAVNDVDWTTTAMVAQGASSLVTSPVFDLSGGGGIPNTPGYDFTLTNEGSGNPTILQKPTQANGFTLIARMEGQAAYQFRVSWTPSDGQPVNFGNLENFGGTDSPIEHPSLETTQ